MLYESQAEETIFLETILSMIQSDYDKIKEGLRQDEISIYEFKKHMWDNVYEMDPAEIRSYRQIVENMVGSASMFMTKQRQFERLLSSPYFGRVNFTFDNKAMSDIIKSGSIVDDADVFNIYIGIHSFINKDVNYIYDWRAPISGMFYDYEPGRAGFTAPKGQVTGIISHKRQYKIDGGIMKYMFDSSVTIGDDILKEELSHAADEKMKNIVATIQKEQNQIIRDEKSDVLIIQGVAGSGKTSIALHRIAYLLYRLKDKIYSENMMIISPNKVFSDYISNVLPELGEDKILQITLDDIADHELDKICGYQTQYEQLSELIVKKDERLAERVKFKSTLEFKQKMDEYIDYLTLTNFTPHTYIYEHDERTYEIHEKYLSDRYDAYKRFPMFKRIEIMLEDILEKMITEMNLRKSKIRFAKVRRAIYGMAKERDILRLYGEFYAFVKRPDMYAGLNDRILPYDDLAPLLYLKASLFSTHGFEYVQHLLIDEMQDYTPAHFGLFNRLFTCKKTILGDVNQLTNPYILSSSQSDIHEVYKALPKTKTNVMELYKSYRSTAEITELAQSIKKNKIEIIERHGDLPGYYQCCGVDGQITKIDDIIKNMTEPNIKSIGIICKTDADAQYIFGRLTNPDKNLLTLNSIEFSPKLTVTAAYLAKGLEFDYVIIPLADDITYNDEIDKQMLYIAVTRALHKLTFTYTGNLSRFLL